MTSRPPTRGHRHRRLGDLVGQGLLLDSEVRLTVNQVGEEIQLVRMGPDFRAQAEYVLPQERTDQSGWIRDAERLWGARGLTSGRRRRTSAGR
jgi:hypothetical protein